MKYPSKPVPAGPIGQLAATPAVAQGPKELHLAAGEASSIGAWSAQAGAAKWPMQQALNNKETSLFMPGKGLLRQYTSTKHGKICAKT